MENLKYEDDAGDVEILEDYVVLDDATTGASSHLDLSNLRKRKIKIISSAKETIENGELIVLASDPLKLVNVSQSSRACHRLHVTSKSKMKIKMSLKKLSLKCL